ncbi:hypothetical protein BDF14DRAFT_1805468 [Spinellus fusiger]|nr:hypothetical protein BDF14DRAFT_1805468 [Spinellus fusiger]
MAQDSNQRRMRASSVSFAANESATHSHHRHYSSQGRMTAAGGQREQESIYHSLSSSAPSFGALFQNINENTTHSAVNPLDIPKPMFSIEFEGGSHVILRPDRIVRGKVLLNLTERIHATRIRIKFRGEESATVKVEESFDSKGEWLHQAIISYFETDWKLWGNDASAYSQCAWEDLDVGYYEFPFALKFPNCNYPPSIEEPTGFSIRFVWSALIDGPGLQSGLRSKDYITPYRPILISTPDKSWVYKTTLIKDKRTVLAEVQAKVSRQSLCPDETFTMQLYLAMIHTEFKCTSIHYKFRKHHEGKVVLQQGTAFQSNVRIILTGTVNSHDTKTYDHITFNIPTRLVSPSFITRHTRVRYDLLFSVTTSHGHLIKSHHVSEFTIPITIANLSHEQLLRLPNTTTIENYRHSTASPFFFDPSLEEPPSSSDIHLIDPSAAHSQGEEPPSYSSLAELPPPFEIRRERKEHTQFMTRPAKNVHLPDMSDAKVVLGLYGEDW